MSNRYTVVRCFSWMDENYQTNGTYILSSLMDMLLKMRNKMYPKIVYDSDMKWLMTRDTFTWIIRNCENNDRFWYQVELSCTESNRYTIMDIEVEFVNCEEFSRNNFVELTYKEPDAVTIAWNPNVETEYLSDYLRKDAEALQECFFGIWNPNNIEARKENKTMPIYVGYGKKVTIENVIFNNPATIVMWSDGTKTVVKRQKGDKKFDPEKGLAMAICKKVMGNKGNFNDIFKEWIEED